jgi:hypothetical protein
MRYEPRQDDAGHWWLYAILPGGFAERLGPCSSEQIARAVASQCNHESRLADRDAA